jgi:microcystin-dependent protein
MPLETATYLHELEASNPASTDQLAQADDHLRLIKAALLATFPNLAGPITKSDVELNASPFAMPIGAITGWYGLDTDVPVGWAICNGQTVSRTDDAGTITTPDMRGRVMVGVSASHAWATTFGAETATATSTSAGAHSHTVPQSPHTHTVSLTGTTGAATASLTVTKDALSTWDKTGGSGHPVTDVTEAPHTHGVSLAGDTGSATGADATSSSDGAHAHDVTVSTLQPSLALHYIMKV